MGKRLILSLSLALLGGCTTVAFAPFALTVAGAGASSAVKYNLDGVAYRTFTAPAPAVKQASIRALEQMGILVRGFDTFENGETIRASSTRRSVEIEVEPISERAARVRVAAKNGGFFYDTATASEIIAQTEKLLERNAASGASVTALSCGPG